jgi:hypothetical protein
MSKRAREFALRDRMASAPSLADFGICSPKVMKLIETGHSYREVVPQLQLDKNTVMAIVRRARNLWEAESS